MIGASKILTVSYGTFSCTLEGFEEPFSTMKAIAEYFRDLAADDRYFGAEPPTPDAEMLHRIAEREIQRRVEAKISEHGVVLRAHHAQAAEDKPFQTMPAAARTAATTAFLADTGAVHAMPEAPAENVVAPAAMAESEPVAHADAGSIAMKLSRLRAVVSDAKAATSDTADEAEDTVESAESVPDDFGFDLDLGDDLPVTRENRAAAPEEEPAAEPAIADAFDGEDMAAQEVEAEIETLAETEPAEILAEEALTDFAADYAAPEATESPEELVEAEEGPADEALQTEELAEIGGFKMTETPAVQTEEFEAADVAEVEAAEALTEDEAVAVEAEAITALDETLAASFEEEAVDEPVASHVAEVEDAFEQAEEEIEATEAEGASELNEPLVASVEDEVEVVDEPVASDFATEEVALEQTEEEAEASEAEVAYELNEPLVASVEEEVEVADEPVASDFATEEEALEQADEEAEAVDEPVASETTQQEALEQAEEETMVVEVTESYVERVQARVIMIERRDEPIRVDLAEETMAEDDSATADMDEPAEEVFAESSEIEAETFEAEAETAEDADEEELRDIFTDDAEAPLEERTAAVLAALADRGGADEDYEAQIDEEDSEANDAALLAGIEAAIGRSGLEPEAEEDLMRELTDVARDSRRDSHEGRAILESESQDGEASVERLMEEAKSKLEGDESRRRFSAIAHLKAAVAATVADRVLKLKESPDETGDKGKDEIDRYRDDLSRAVRPRRHLSDSVPSTLRPTLQARPAPLVLVSEQRVDASNESAREVTPVRPRRVSASNLTSRRSRLDDEEIEETESLSPEEANNFAEFAERLGASGLSDLLEAAAAYTATVEGMPHFSRPEILRKVARMAEDEDYSREDSLRSFGMLLREGKIQKISRGQFTITDSSRFMAEARHASR